MDIQFDKLRHIGGGRILKKIICTLLIVILLTSPAFPLFADNERIMVKLNNMDLSFDVPPANIVGRTMVPLRQIFEELGMEVLWNEATKAVVGKKAGLEIRLQQDNNNAFVNGNKILLDVPSKSINGRTLVPVRFIAESTGAKVFWDEYNKTVYISTSNDNTLTLDKIKASADLSSEGWRLDKTGKSDDALLHFDKAIALDSFNCNAYYNKGLVYEKQNKLGEALKNYDAALKININSTIVHYTKANALYNFGRYIESARDYEEFAKYSKDKSKGTMISIMATMLFGKKRYEESILFYDIVIKYCTDNVELAYNNKAAALGYLNRYEEALQNYDKAIQLNPNVSKFYNNKGFIYMSKGNYEEAIKWFDKAIQLEPKVTDYYLNKGYSLFNLQKYDEAIESLTKSLTDDASIHTYGLIVQSLIDQKKYQEAHKYCDAAIKVIPNNAYIYVMKGSIFFLEKKYKESIEIYNKAAELDNNYVTPYYHNAINYAIIDDQEKALEYLRKAIELDSTIKFVAPKLSYFDKMKSNIEFIKLMSE